MLLLPVTTLIREKEELDKCWEGFLLVLQIFLLKCCKHFTLIASRPWQVVQAVAMTESIAIWLDFPPHLYSDVQQRLQRTRTYSRTRWCITKGDALRVIGWMGRWVGGWGVFSHMKCNDNTTILRLPSFKGAPPPPPLQSLGFAFQRSQRFTPPTSLAVLLDNSSNYGDKVWDLTANA